MLNGQSGRFGRFGSFGLRWSTTGRSFLGTLATQVVALVVVVLIIAVGLVLLIPLAALFLVAGIAFAAGRMMRRVRDALGGRPSQAPSTEIPSAREGTPIPAHDREGRENVRVVRRD